MQGKEPSQLSLLKELLGQALDLFIVRMKMARVDVRGLKDVLLLVVISGLVIAVVFFLGFICLLFGLNAVLSPPAKIWVFFGLALLALIVIVTLVVRIMSALQSQQGCFQNTLEGLHDDIAYLRGQKRYSDIHIQELEDDS